MAPARRTRRAATPKPANEAENPYLPSVDTQQSFSYGSTNTPVLPRQLGANASANAEDLAAILDADIRPRVTESAGFSQIENEARNSPEKQRLTRGQRRAGSVLSARESMSPAREIGRQRTPENQLMSTLREASGEPEEPLDHLADAIERSSISWNTERHLLPTEQPQPSQSNLHGAPRVPLGWPRPGRQNEQLTVPMSPSRASSISVRWPLPSPGAAHLSPRSQTHLQAQAQRSRETAERIERGAAMGVPVGSPVGVLQPATATVLRPTRTSTRVDTAAAAMSTASEQPDTPKSEHTPASSRRATPSPAPPTAFTGFSYPTLSGIPFSISHLVTILLTLMVAFSAYIVRDDIKFIAQSIHFPCSPCKGHSLTPIQNYTDAMDRIFSTVDRRLTSMTNDIISLKEEWNKRPPPPPPPPANPLEPRRANFFALGMGALVDPYLTSPTKSSTGGFMQRFHRYAAGIRPGPPPVAALTQWDEVGDCWCAATTNGKAQLAVLLGRPIVPDEVIIEHIPREATLDPGSAPQTMEMWAEYKLAPPRVARKRNSAPSTSRSPSSLPPSDPSDLPDASDLPSDPLADPPTPSDHQSLYTTVMDGLKTVYPDDHPSTYSNDIALGPSFFRVGTWTYDINAEHHIQRFRLQAVIDLPNARVQRVVVRVTSNWGGRQHTCLYRVRLHGHL
ncbi:hypothetical protein FQN49_003337 [Arthroderma sp. PD_2]|nr:hypothetical protein FQN49_003337 [Arthroderma sp. PD_2]